MSEGGRFLGLKVAGLAAVAAVWLIAASAAGAQLTIPAGDDLFETEPNNTTSSFGGPTTLDAQASGLLGEFAFGPPLPAGFFGQTCEEFGAPSTSAAYRWTRGTSATPTRSSDGSPPRR